MISWLRLIRWSNLLIILLTQLLVWVCVIRPAGLQSPMGLLLDLKHFTLLSLSTIFIAAAGYIINDYFDIRIDNINKPDRMILERKIPRRMAIILHTVLNVLAILFAALVARQAGAWSWLIIQLLCTLLLWFYSTHFKRQFLTGNLVVALLTALTIMVLIVYEPAMHYYAGQEVFIRSESGAPLANPIWVLSVYAGFAFLLTWMREIVKDMEDFKGDEAEGCMTMPIRWGLSKAGSFTQVLSAFALFPLLIAGIRLIVEKEWALGIYTLLALVVPLIMWTIFLPKSQTTEHFGKASRYLKLIMVSGVGSLVIYYLEANA